MATDYRRLYDFTYRNEVQAGVSDRPHRPPGDSGLTLGPGYDIGSRTKGQVVRFLVDEIGLAEADVELFAGGAGLKGADAETYYRTHRSELHKLRLSVAQEEKIFAALAAQYEAGLERFLAARHPGAWAQLDDDQKCMLFDYHYNVGISKFPKFCKAVIEKDWRTARAESVRRGLEGTRRERETFAFLDAHIADDSGTAFA